MDFRKLQAFAKVYETRSFSRAGEALYLSQPTVSAHVAALEEELGALLFDRLGRSVVPTQAAAVLYAATRDVFSRLDEAVSEIHLLQNRVAGEVLVGGSSIPAHYILPERLAAFVRRHPEASLRLVVGDSAGIAAQVAAGGLALAVVGADFGQPELELKPLLDDEILVIGPSAMVRAAPSDPRQLAALPWVLREEGSGTRRAFDQALRGLGLSCGDLRAAALVESTEAVLRCVRAGMGLGVVSGLAASEGLARGEFAVLPLALDLRRTFFLALRKGRTLTPAARVLAEFLTAAGS
jgi:DNA-binding transcriptional LysR family regulator